MTTLAELEHQICALSPPERHHLTEVILASFDTDIESDQRQSWKVEIEKRVATHGRTHIGEAYQTLMRHAKGGGEVALKNLFTYAEQRNAEGHFQDAAVAFRDSAMAYRAHVDSHDDS